MQIKMEHLRMIGLTESTGFQENRINTMTILEIHFIFMPELIHPEGKLGHTSNIKTCSILVVPNTQ